MQFVLGANQICKLPPRPPGSWFPVISMVACEAPAAVAHERLGFPPVAQLGGLLRFSRRLNYSTTDYLSPRSPLTRIAACPNPFPLPFLSLLFFFMPPPSLYPRWELTVGKMCIKPAPDIMPPRGARTKTDVGKHISSQCSYTRVFSIKIYAQIK